MKMSLSYQYLDVKLDLLDGLGFAKSQALDMLRILPKELAHSQNRISIDKFLTCLQAAADVTADPYIGLRLGHKFRVGTFGTTGRIYGYCENIDEVISMNNLYQKIAIDAGRVKYIKPANEGHQMCFMPHYSDLVEYRPITDMVMASYVTAYKWLSWGSGEDLICARLPYIKPEEVESYADILQMPIQIESEHISLELSDVAMSHQITTQNSERLAFARVTLDRLMGDQDASFSFEQAVAAAIRGAIETGHVSSEVVAQRMGLSGHDLRAQLAESGEGMRPRIDRIRKTLFVEKFDAGHSFSQIAMDLAYNDQAAMNRAFRRWFGMTPSQWRARALQNSEKSY